MVQLLTAGGALAWCVWQRRRMEDPRRLTTMVLVLGGIVTMLLSLALNRMFATPSLPLLISHFDPTRRSHQALGAANVSYIWAVGVMSIGLAKLSGTPVLRAAIPVSVYWVLQQTLLILTGLGHFAL